MFPFLYHCLDLYSFVFFLFFPLFENIFFHFIYSNCVFLRSVPFPVSPYLPVIQVHSLSVSHKKDRLLWNNNKITNKNKTKQKLSHWIWTRQTEEKEFVFTVFMPPLLQGFLSSEESHLMGTSHLRLDFPRSLTMHNVWLWVSSFFSPFAAGGIFSDEGWARHWLMDMEECH